MVQVVDGAVVEVGEESMMRCGVAPATVRISVCDTPSASDTESVSVTGTDSELLKLSVLVK